MKHIYKGLPEVISEINVVPVYGLNCLYMPIHMKEKSGFYIPDSFQFLKPIINKCLENCEFINRYVYISYECSWVNAGKSQKREGVHADGFMTDDINYIWYDKDPTIFYDQDFEIERNHEVSMKQFEAQADVSSIVTYPNKTLLRLTEQIVHETSIPTISGVRQFFKLSISKDKYNLKGNTKNPLIDYDWIMHERSVVRNHPIYKETDSFPDSAAV